MHLERVRGRGPGGVSPQSAVDQPLARDDLVRAQEQKREERATPSGRDGDGLAVPARLDRPEQGELPAFRSPHRPP